MSVLRDKSQELENGVKGYGNFGKEKDSNAVENIILSSKSSVTR